MKGIRQCMMLLTVLLGLGQVVGATALTPAWETVQSGGGGFLRGVDFIDSNTGWVVGEQGVILRTLDGGNNWEPLNGGTTQNLRNVDFVDSNTGWVAGDTRRTLDGGDSWTNISPPGRHVTFLDTNTGWIVGSSGQIFHTKQDGVWNLQFSGTSNLLNSVDFTDANTGWTVGTNGTVLHTTNGGATWFPQNSNISNSLWAVDFIDSSTGWAAGTNGTILHTVDGGANWNLQDTPRQGNVEGTLWNITFINPSTGWVVGNDGEILHTKNGGTTWNPQVSGTTEILYDIAYDGDTTLWAVGFNNTILKYTDPSIPEPSTLILFLAGIFGISGYGYCHKHRKNTT